MTTDAPLPPLACVICGRDAPGSVCTAHIGLLALRRRVRDGRRGDWYGVARHDEMLTNAGLAERPDERGGHGMYAELAALLIVKSVEMALPSEQGIESGGDWLAVRWLLDFGDTGDGRQAA